MGASALRPGTMQNYGWKGKELVAVRLHLPSRIVDHNARDIDSNEGSAVQRGNILAWEQLLTDRLDGRPISIEVRMDRQSILYTTLVALRRSVRRCGAAALRDHLADDPKGRARGGDDLVSRAADHPGDVSTGRCEREAFALEALSDVSTAGARC